MVRVTYELLERSISMANKRKQNESQEKFLNRITHLHLENKSIDDVSTTINLCQNLNVLYLYDNCLTQIPDLSDIPQLSQLYLQNNLITRMENLSEMIHLTKLYLGGNQIIVIEGISSLRNLQELNVENQKLPDGEKLIFDPLSIAGICKTLEILCVSANRLDDLNDFIPLENLTHFSARENEIQNFDDVSNCLMLWRSLKELDLSRNPLCKHRQYRDTIIVMNASLEKLDGKEIRENSRKFIENLAASREASKVKQRMEASGKGKGRGPYRANGEPLSADSSGGSQLKAFRENHGDFNNRYLKQPTSKQMDQNRKSTKNFSRAPPAGVTHHQTDSVRFLNLL